METFALLLLYSFGLRWLIFQYKKTAFIRELLRAIKVKPLDSLAAELLQCCYCQMVEASTVVYLTLTLIRRIDLSFPEILLAIVANGWIMVITEYFFESAIDKMEDFHGFHLKK